MTRELQRILGALILLYLIGSTIFYYFVNDYYEKEAYKNISQAVNYNRALQEYVSGVQKPAVFKLLETNGIDSDYFDPALLSSTYIASHVNEAFMQLRAETEGHAHHGIGLKFASDNPTNPQNRATPYESNILERFNNEELTEYTETLTLEGEEYFFYALPVKRNNAQCLTCHGKPEDAPKSLLTKYGSKNGFGEREGEIRAIIAMYHHTHTDNEEKIFFFFIIEGLMLTIFALIFLIIVYYTKKIAHKDLLLAKQSRFAAMGEMISMIAHQWRQPLTGIGMTANNMSLDIQLQTIDEEKWESNLEQISRQVQYLSQTIDDFRNFFRPGQKPADVALDKLLQESTQIISKALDDNNIVIEYRYHDKPIIKTYRNELLQVFLNLFKNTIDAYNENKITERPLTLTLEKLLDSVRIRITDRAGGIPPDIMAKIFNPYFSTKDDKNGTGLGLYMSKMIIEEHLQGTIDVLSDNGSTTFTIILPAETFYEENSDE